jgi:hypothetical protein
MGPISNLNEAIANNGRSELFINESSFVSAKLGLLFAHYISGSGSRVIFPVLQTVVGKAMAANNSSI